MEHNNIIEPSFDAIAYLKNNPYGLFYGDDSSGVYELDWYETSEAAFNSALETVIVEMVGFEELDVSAEEKDLSADARNFVRSLREKFSSEGLSKELLESINQALGETQGFGWWGTFDQLKQGDSSIHGDLLRCRFRENDNSGSITDKEEEESFAKWVTKSPLT